MHSVDELASAARSVNLSTFVASFGNAFLLKSPSSHDSRWDADIEYQTVFQAAPTAPDPASDLEDEAAFGASWRIATIRKREGNPYPDRISIGRAKNCDIVIRLSQISKLHAHFIVSPQGLALADQNSVNGTFVNGRRLAPGEATAVFDGDVICFAQIELQLMDGARVHAFLRNNSVG